MTKTAAITTVAEADRALALAKDVHSAVQLVTTGQTLKAYAQAAKVGEEQESLVRVFVLRAQRNAGEQIGLAVERGEMPSHGGVRGNQHTGGKLPMTNLPDLGITVFQSGDWQALSRAYPTDNDLVADIAGAPNMSLAAALRLAKYNAYVTREAVLSQIDLANPGVNASERVIAHTTTKVGREPTRNELIDTAEVLFPVRVQPRQFPVADDFVDWINAGKQLFDDHWADVSPAKKTHIIEGIKSLLIVFEGDQND